MPNREAFFGEELPLINRDDLRAQVRALRRRFLRWSQDDLLRLTADPVSAYVVEKDGRRCAISVARQRVAQGRVAVLVLGRSDEQGQSAFVTYEGLVVSSHHHWPLSDKPRIEAKLYGIADQSARQVLEISAPSEGGPAEPRQSTVRRSSLAPHRRQ